MIKSCENISSFLSEDKAKDDQSEDDVEPEKDEEEVINEKSELLAKIKPKESEEESKSGTIARSVYLGYLKSGAGLFSGFILVVSSILAHGCSALSDLWISKWTNDEDVQIHQNNTNIEAIEESNQFYLMIYGSIVMSLILAIGVSSIQYFVTCMTASRTLHDRMFERLLRACPR